MSEPVDLDEIEARANAAKAEQGRWFSPTARGLGTDLESWAQHIAGMDPATALALVAEVRALRAKVEAVEVLANEIEAGDWGYEWRQNNVHGAIRAALRSGEPRA